MPNRTPLELEEAPRPILRLAAAPATPRRRRAGATWARSTVTVAGMARTLVGSAVGALRRPRSVDDPAPAGPALRTFDSTALAALLPYALAQAHRHREPLTLLCVEIDRLDAIRALLGDAFAREVVDLTAGTIRRLIRASDVVARLDDDRLIVLLPAAGGDDAVRLAESTRAAIAAIERASQPLPMLTASIGVANYPAHGDDPQSLLAAAAEAAALARQNGRERSGPHNG